MFFYLVIFFAAFIVSFLYSKAKDKYFAVVFKITLFMILWLPLCLRYDVGTDYANYVRHINNYYLSNKFIFELGYLPLFYLMKFYEMDYQIFFIVTSFLTIFFLFQAIERKYFYIAIPAYLCSAYLSSFNVVRQMLGITCMLVAIKYILKKDFLKYIIWCIIAFFFHKSVIISIVIVPFCLLDWKVFNPFFNIFIFFVVYILLSKFNIVGFLIERIIGNTFYSVYVNSKFNTNTEMSSGMGFLLWLLMYLCLATYSTKDTSLVESDCWKRNTRKYKIEYNLSCILIFASEASRILASQIHIFNRVNANFYASYTIMAIVLAKSTNKYKKIILLFLLVAAFMQYYVSVKSGLSSLDGGLGINPYKSIFAR